MTKDTLENLKKDLDFIKIKISEKEKARKEKDRDSIESDIQYLTEQMIDKYELIKYDSGIKMESYKTKFFISDVESVIRKQEGVGRI